MSHRSACQTPPPHTHTHPHHHHKCPPRCFFICSEPRSRSQTLRALRCVGRVRSPVCVCVRFLVFAKVSVWPKTQLSPEPLNIWDGMREKCNSVCQPLPAKSNPKQLENSRKMCLSVALFFPVLARTALLPVALSCCQSFGFVHFEVN